MGLPTLLVLALLGYSVNANEEQQHEAVMVHGSVFKVMAVRENAKLENDVNLCQAVVWKC